MKGVPAVENGDIMMILLWHGGSVYQKLQKFEMPPCLHAANVSECVPDKWAEEEGQSSCCQLSQRGLKPDKCVKEESGGQK